MPIRDCSHPNHPLPLFLSGHADELQQWGTSRILKASILVIAVTVSGIAIALSLRNPVKVFAYATASLTDNSAAQRGAIESTSTIQSTTGVQLLQSRADVRVPTSTSAGASARGEIPAAREPANQARIENSEPPPGTMLTQFQAWEAKENSRAQKPVEVAPAEVKKTYPAAVQMHRRARSARKARAEVRHIRKSKTHRYAHARRKAPSAKNARAQEQPLQYARAASFMLVWHQ